MHQKSKKKVDVSCKKYIGLSVRTKRSLSALQKALQKHCKNTVRVGVMNKPKFYLTTALTTATSLSLNIKGIKRKEIHLEDHSPHNAEQQEHSKSSSILYS